MRGPVAVTFQDEAAPWGISTSVVLHALFAAILALMPIPKRMNRPEEERVSVDILTLQQFEASTRPPPAPAAAAAQDPVVTEKWDEFGPPAAH